jgi:mRNA interferase MazF
MDKDFDGWNVEKQMLHSGVEKVFCHSREIWWCALGVNIGFEQDGTGENFDRPVIVIRGFNENIFLGAALTGKKKEGKFYFPIGLIEEREATVILSQVRLINTKRLVRKMDVLDEGIFKELKNALRRTLFD